MHLFSFLPYIDGTGISDAPCNISIMELLYEKRWYIQGLKVGLSPSKKVDFLCLNGSFLKIINNVFTSF